MNRLSLRIGQECGSVHLIPRRGFDMYSILSWFCSVAGFLKLIAWTLWDFLLQNFRGSLFIHFIWSLAVWIFNFLWCLTFWVACITVSLIGLTDSHRTASDFIKIQCLASSDFYEWFWASFAWVLNTNSIYMQYFGLNGLSNL